MEQVNNRLNGWIWLGIVKLLELMLKQNSDMEHLLEV